MTVQTGPGAIIVAPDDFQRTDRGITWSIQCREVGDGMQFVQTCIKGADGVWQWDSTGELDGGFETTTGWSMYGSVNEWLKQKMVPKLNSWLAVKFPAGAVPPPPPSGDPFAQADLAINTRLVITVAADGTLVASLKP